MEAIIRRCAFLTKFGKYRLDVCIRYLLDLVNPLPPSGAVRERKKIILEDLFGSVLSHLKKYHPSVNLNFDDLGIF